MISHDYVGVQRLRAVAEPPATENSQPHLPTLPTERTRPSFWLRFYRATEESASRSSCVQLSPSPAARRSNTEPAETLGAGPS